jgi:hypothetical protein
MVEDGAPFCPRCNAPQIRVNAAPPAPGTPGNLQPPAVPLEPPRLHSPATLPSAVIAGITMGILSLVPVVSLGCCLWMVLGGIFAVHLYQRRAPGPVTAGMGARLGALSGLFGFVVYALGFTGQIFLFGHGANIREQMVKALQDAAARNPDPNAQQVAQRMASPEGIAIIIVIGLLAFLVGFLLFSSIGGAIGAAIFGKRPSSQRP